ncbi:hypothetical protein SH449x_000160 [Pirellulaceae bacterium SH449]
MNYLSYNPDLTLSSSRVISNRKDYVYLLGGGLGNDMLPISIALRPASTVAIDVPKELRKSMEMLRYCLNAHPVEIGGNHTSKSLMEGYVADDSPIHGKIGNCLSENGMGQVSGLGRIAGFRLVKDRVFDELLNQLRVEYTIQNNGLIPPLKLAIFGSGAGGVNAGICTVAADGILDDMSALDIPLEANFHLVDSMTFTGLGSACDLNYVNSTRKLIELAQRTNQAPKGKRVVNVRLITLPPTGKDSLARKRFALQEAQAWLSTDVQNWFLIVGPNFANSHPLGNVLQTNAEFFRAIPSDSIVNEIARGYSDNIQTSLKKVVSAPHLIRYVDAIPVRSELCRIDIYELTAKHETLSVDQYLAAVQEPGCRINYVLEISDIRGRRFQCDKLPDYFTAPAKSLDDTIDALITVQTIRDKLTTERSELLRQDARIQKMISKHARSVRKLKARRPRFRGGQRKKVQKLKNFSAVLRELADKRHELSALISEAGKCIKIASELLQRQRSLPESVLQMLEQHKLPLNDFALQGLVYFEPTNTVYSDLLAMLPAGKSTQATLLALKATSVTEEGLKYILNVSTADTHHVAAVVVGEAFTPGAWVAGIKRTPEHTMLVFPRMSAPLAQSLQDEITKMRPDWLVFFTDSCSVGANVVRINICCPKSLEECLPGYLGKLLKDSENSVISVLHKIPSEPVPSTTT